MLINIFGLTLQTHRIWSLIIKSTTVRRSPWVSLVVRSASVLLYLDMLWSFITSRPQNDVSHTSLAWRQMCSDTTVTLFKGKTIRFLFLLSSGPILRAVIQNSWLWAGKSCRWCCMISPLWISAGLRLRLKQTSIRPKGSLKIRPCLQVINEVFRLFFFALYFPCTTCQNQVDSSSRCPPVNRLKR